MKSWFTAERSVHWLADECVTGSLVENLRAAGMDVVYVAELTAGASDSDVISWARRENRLLLTEDKDFGELVFRKAQTVPGLVLLRMEPELQSLQWPRLQAAIDKFGAGLFGRYTVIEVQRFRSRRLFSARS